MIGQLKSYALFSTWVMMFAASFTACGQELSSLRRAVPTTAANVAGSTFKLDVVEQVSLENVDASITRGQKELGAEIVGTAWIVGQEGGRSLVATAGHMCLSQLSENIEGYTLPVLTVSYGLIAVDNKRYTMDLHVLVDDDKNDICILEAQDIIAPPLQIASADPVYGGVIHYVGAPGGEWQDTMQPIYVGQFAGRRWQQNPHAQYIAVTVAAAGGASGSPVYGPDGVIGVLDATSNQAHDLVFVAPWDILAVDLQSAIVLADRGE